MSFQPNYKNLQKAAYNQAPDRLPLYEHVISDKIIERVLKKEFRDLIHGGARDKEEYFSNYCAFYKTMGYDTVSFERCVGEVMPDSGCLGQHKESVIHDRADFEKYPWDEIPERYFSRQSKYFEALKNTLPDGMAAVGGVGNGIFECVQDVIGYMNLCYISSDDPDLYADLFKRVGDILLRIWQKFMDLYGDLYCVLRIGDDLGFNSNSLISKSDIQRHIVPAYAKIIQCVHSYGKPFLLHSCGNIFNVMPDFIETAKINAKHSNEDEIAPFSVWVEKHGDKIAIFGGMDADALCRLSLPEIRDYVTDILRKYGSSGGIAFGSGNSIPEYVPVENYVEMVNTVRKYRGDFN